jgi:hypothetical protein
MQRNPEVLKEIESIEAGLIASGVREYCLACIYDPSRGGCCHGCKNLDANGCIEKPLSCATWLCMDVERKFPEFAKGLSVVKHNMIAKFGGYVALGYRTMSLDNEKRLVQIQEIK